MPPFCCIATRLGNTQTVVGKLFLTAGPDPVPVHLQNRIAKVTQESHLLRAQAHPIAHILRAPASPMAQNTCTSLFSKLHAEGVLSHVVLPVRGAPNSSTSFQQFWRSSLGGPLAVSLSNPINTICFDKLTI